MMLDNNLNGHNDIAHFLEKFKEEPCTKPAEPDLFSVPRETSSVRPAQYARSFEKLEQKIHELEEKFEASTTQNQLVLSELSRTREIIERQKDKDAFLEHLSHTIDTLRTSVENLSHTQQAGPFAFCEAPIQRSLEPFPSTFALSSTQSSMYEMEQENNRLRQEQEEQERLFTSLRQKASQLKAVNSALDREIKKAQQEKTDALKKSAEQAKEILSLRDQLTAAEERFKSFDFEGRIISIKQEYQQKVSSLETELKAMSDTCVKQVEEIEQLKQQNTKLQDAVAEKAALQAQLTDKEKELSCLQDSIASLQTQHSDQRAKQLASFTTQLRAVEEQRDRLTIELEQSQMSLENMRRDKEMVEKNFKELMVRIDHNDAVIAQLKQKIEVLGKQNEELTQSNAILTQDNAALSQTNLELTRRNAALTQRNEKLIHAQEEKSASLLELTRRNAALTQRNEKLIRAQEEKSSSLVSALKRPEKPRLQIQPEEIFLSKESIQKTPHTPVLAQHDEARSLKSQSAAALAARLVQQHAQEQGEKKGVNADSKQAPVPTGLYRSSTTVLHSLGRTLAVSAAADEEWEVIPAKSSQMTKNIQSEQDLPEIKVATTTVQEDLFDGEDFLEKTDSFIGRMKWSIFRENR